MHINREYRNTAILSLTLLLVVAFFLSFLAISSETNGPISGRAVAPIEELPEPSAPDPPKNPPINNQTNQTNTTIRKSSSGGSGGGGGGGGGGGSGSTGESSQEQSSNQTSSNNQTNQTLPPENNQTNQTSQGNQTNQTSPSNQTNTTNLTNLNIPSFLSGRIINLAPYLILKSENLFITQDDLDLAPIRLQLFLGDLQISEFDANVSGTMDVSNIVANISTELGKSFIHSAQDHFTNIDLYVPRLSGQDGVIVCENADSFDEVRFGCADEPDVTNEFILEQGDPRLQISGDGKYFIVLGITGTGATGANVTEIISSRALADSPSNHSAIAGNITEISITAVSTTQSWQGYFGNVSGTIQLADASDNALYNWSLANPEGEVFASTNETISWANIQCFNFTATGTHDSSGEPAGNTSINGTNLTQLEDLFNISFDDVDGVDETFDLLGAGTHDSFYAGQQSFSEGECQSTRVFGDSGQGESDEFEEALMYDPITTSVIFAALIEESAILGFDNQYHDFEMLVLENGHGTDIASTTYYFFVEIG